MSNDSSSSEEETEKFKEALDENFLPENLYKNGTLEEKLESTSKPSLRNQSHQTTSTNPFSLKVTPQFQKHVSEHLSKILDEIIDDSKIIFKKRKPEKKLGNSGIKLLRSSKDYLTQTHEKHTDVNLRSAYKKRDSNSIDFEKRAKEVAVSPEWILSKQEVKHWAPETKGEMEIVKLDNISKKSKYSGRNKVHFKK